MANILLTSENPRLIAAIKQMLPTAIVSSLRPGEPIRPQCAEAWCFIDWVLDDTSGLELCRRIKADPATASSHVTMVLESDEAASRQRALKAGADDYIVGPITADRLVERIRQYRTEDPALPQPVRMISTNGLSVVPEAQQVRWQGRLIPLSPREYRLLTMFLDQPDRLLSRKQMLVKSGKLDQVSDERTVDVWVGRLRRTLTRHGVPPVLRTVRSIGYVFDTP